MTTTDVGQTIAALAIVLPLGIMLGACLPGDPRLTGPANVIDSMLGQLYFLSWAASFLPQLYSNCSRRSVEGMSHDMVALGTLGFGVYAAYSVALYVDAPLREAYGSSHGGATPPVQPADVSFTLYGCACELLALGQIAAYARRSSFSRPALAAVGVATLGMGVAAVAMRAMACGAASWLTYLTAISYLKLAVTLLKYSPQIALNQRRRSTEGFHIGGIVLDMLGSVLSCAQLMYECVLLNAWSGAEGDPVKFGLGMLTLLFDVVLLLQRFVLFPTPAAAEVREGDDVKVEGEERTALLVAIGE